jgi:tRNA threonylcarbamoyladenosine biosynthesis protein TsaB
VRAKPVPAWTLALDASTITGTVAVLRDGVLASADEALMRGEREERLMPAVLRALASAGCNVHDISCVICGSGPGSFTSLRIAGAIAKGIVVGNGAELFAVSSLALLVAGRRTPLPAGRYLALLDAMRAERHASIFEIGADQDVREVERLGRIRDADVAAVCARFGARAVGPREMLEASPHARGAAPMLHAILAAGPVPLDGWEPDYGRAAEAQVRWEAAHGRAMPER